MIVLDTSIFIDLLFEYKSERTRSAEDLLLTLEENGLTIVEPDLFKIEFTGQIARRIKKEQGTKICEKIFADLKKGKNMLFQNETTQTFIARLSSITM